MWEDIREWAAIIIALLALVAAGWSAWYSRRSANAANRSATASEISAQAASESAAADTKLAALAEAEANKYVPPWNLVPGGKKGKYLLVNGSDDETAYNVVITGDVVVPDPRDEIGPRESVVVVDARDFDSSEPPTVSWNRPPEKGGEPKKWKGSFA